MPLKWRCLHLILLLGEYCPLMNHPLDGKVKFNVALDTFYEQLFCTGHRVKNGSDSERGNLLPPHGLLFPISSKGFLYATSHRQDNTYHSLCYTSRGAGQSV